MRSLFGVTVVVLGILGSAAGAHAQTFTVYDKFTGALSPALWSGFELNTNSSVVSNTEQQRAVVQPDPAVPNRFLQLGLRTGHPGTTADAGVAGEGRQTLRVARDDIQSGDPSVVGMKTKMVITSVKTPACPTSDDPAPLANQSRGRGQLAGFFFNDGSSTGPTDATGDIVAGVNVEQRSTEGKVIVAFIVRCTNASCSTLTTAKSVVFGRRWTLNTAVPVTIVWDRANDQFVYTVGAEVQTLTYSDLGFVDATPSVLLIYQLLVINTAPNCSSPVGISTTARFDLLQVATEAGVFP